LTGAQFGEMKYLLNAVLDATTCEAHNLKQLITISRKGKLSLQSKLRANRTMAAVGGLNAATCNLTGKVLGHQPRVIFFEESTEYGINAIAADPDQEPSADAKGRIQNSAFKILTLAYFENIDQEKFGKVVTINV